jgi:2-methylisocitrate lyase-like PEP mutase family enzyme
VRRAKAYLAWRDCIYLFGLSDVEIIARLVKALDGAPINIVARLDTRSPSSSDRSRASASLGAALAVMSLIKQIAQSCTPAGASTC